MNKMQQLSLALSGLTREQVRLAVEAAYCTPNRNVPTNDDVWRHVLANQPPSPPLLDPVAAAAETFQEALQFAAKTPFDVPPLLLDPVAAAERILREVQP